MKLAAHQIKTVSSALSAARMGTYLNATDAWTGARALDMHVWNALAAGAFFSTLHVCEIVIRNAIADALELKYGANWPWDTGFERTLASWNKGELQAARKGAPHGSSGKVIAGLKFGFWCKLFTAGQDQHLWNAHLHTVFPLLPFPLTVAAARKILSDDMEALRGFRNRIAHHEPIFAYPLTQHQKRIHRLIKLRCGQTEQWMRQWEIVTISLATQP